MLQNAISSIVRSLHLKSRLLLRQLLLPSSVQPLQLGQRVRMSKADVLPFAGVALPIEQQIDRAIADVLPAAVARRLLLTILPGDAPEERPLLLRRLAGQDLQQVDTVERP